MSLLACMDQTTNSTSTSHVNRQNNLTDISTTTVHTNIDAYLGTSIDLTISSDLADIALSTTSLDSMISVVLSDRGMVAITDDMNTSTENEDLFDAMIEDQGSRTPLDYEVDMSTVIDAFINHDGRDEEGYCPLGYSAMITNTDPCWSTDSSCIHEHRTCVSNAGEYDCPQLSSCSFNRSCEPCLLAHCESCFSTSVCLLCDTNYRLNEEGQCEPYETEFRCDNDEGEFITLNLRIHIMRDINHWLHETGAQLNNDHLSREDVIDEILPEVNRIWDQANIRWILESVIDEDVVRTSTYDTDVAYVMSAGRDEDGRSDPTRLPPLHRMMDDRYRSTEAQLNANANLFHLYLFPFIGNTGQGNAMRSFNFSTVTSTWSNKNKPTASNSSYCVPQRRPFVEPWNRFRVGSVSQTIAHEVGHVLGLRHDDCIRSGGCLMRSNGYVFNPDQICTSRLLAKQRTAL